MPRFIEKKKNDVKVGDVTLLQREDGSYAVPGGGKILDRGHAFHAAKNLLKSHKNIKSPISALADKTVNRIEYSMRSDRSLMGA